MLIFKKIIYKNLLAVGSSAIEVDLKKNGLTLITGQNGCGKCLDPSTKIDIEIKDCSIEKIFLEFMKNR
jgi:Tfp pilus assembly pilus retraction ATPase PilT